MPPNYGLIELANKILGNLESEKKDPEKWDPGIVSQQEIHWKGKLKEQLALMTPEDKAEYLRNKIAGDLTPFLEDKTRKQKEQREVLFAKQEEEREALLANQLEKNLEDPRATLERLENEMFGSSPAGYEENPRIAEELHRERQRFLSALPKEIRDSIKPDKIVAEKAQRAVENEDKTGTISPKARRIKSLVDDFKAIHEWY